MNIHPCPVYCLFCRQGSTRKHGVYVRKGFHARMGSTAMQDSVQRYRCLNRECKRATFSILPEDVLPLCRFRWSDLVSVQHALGAGTSVYHLARHVWGVGRGMASV
jgi:transposase-like protein